MDLEKLTQDTISEMTKEMDNFPPHGNEPFNLKSFKKGIIEISATTCAKMLEKYNTSK
ncbi:MAG: hypothetical protein H6Q70_476 [Firmicutes bacterium]|nr:hypothetical protein [Bacillota bacterium]